MRRVKLSWAGYRSTLKGLGMSVRLRTASSLTRTSKHPFRGFSGLILTSRPGFSALSSFSSFVARVLNAPQLLQASMITPDPPEAAGSSAAAAAFALLFFGLGATSASVSLRFVPFFGGILTLHSRKGYRTLGRGWL